jgi:hypothetical protein
MIGQEFAENHRFQQLHLWMQFRQSELLLLSWRMMWMSFDIQSTFVFTSSP